MSQVLQQKVHLNWFARAKLFNESFWASLRLGLRCSAWGIYYSLPQRVLLSLWLWWLRLEDSEGWRGTHLREAAPACTSIRQRSAKSATAHLRRPICYAPWRGPRIVRRDGGGIHHSMGRRRDRRGQCCRRNGEVPSDSEWRSILYEHWRDN